MYQQAEPSQSSQSESNVNSVQQQKNHAQGSEPKAKDEIVDQSPKAQQAAQLKSVADRFVDKKQPIQRKNNTGLPDKLKTGVENLSGYSMDDVKVHYNSDKPAQLQAHAYAQGNQIHIAPGQEKHLPHEAWHVVQQKQGRVKPTTQLKANVNINDDEGLEKEADVMGAKAMNTLEFPDSELGLNFQFEVPHQLIQRQEDNLDSGNDPKEIIDLAVEEAAADVETMSTSKEDETENDQVLEDETEAPQMEEEEGLEADDEQSDGDNLENASDPTFEEEVLKEANPTEVKSLEAEIEKELKDELDKKVPESDGTSELDAPAQRTEKVVQRVKRKNRARAARPVRVPERQQPPRRNRQIVRLDNGADQYFANQRRLRIELAMRMGAYRRVLQRTIAAYANYPQGSYGHGRWLYLTRALGNLGANRMNLLNFDVASVEIDHSPHDAAQRVGARVDDEASRHRVAVPLPRDWHRRHQTTHGPGAIRHNAAFSAAQVALVAAGNYAIALQNHLLDTFSDGAMGASGADRISQVAAYARNAVDYAQTNIPVSIFPGHVANTPAITPAQHAAILAALRARIAVIQTQPRRAAVVNPF